ncbi:MAG: 16S rRNA (cytosine(1402)-N(4))-methyltransferase RsmH [Planctomycetota bacterium]
MNTSPEAHIPVLAQEIADCLALKVGGCYVDCTAGLGGHAEMMARRIGPSGVVVLNDVDPANLRAAEGRVREAVPGMTVHSIQGNFVSVPRRVAELGLQADAVLADLGFASNQMDDGLRGFSFRQDGPLDMRLDPALPRTAADLINELPEAELAEIIFRFGEERVSRRIAAKVAAVRKERPIETTAELADLVTECVGSPRPGKSSPGNSKPIHPATRTFQALRIAVNDELGALDGLLEAVGRVANAPQGSTTRQQGWLAEGARVGIISFHSLEDRPVKRAFGGWAKRGRAKSLTAKPIVAQETEVGSNPRSRSAKFRAIALV